MPTPLHGMPAPEPDPLSDVLEPSLLSQLESLASINQRDTLAELHVAVVCHIDRCQRAMQQELD